MRLHVKGWNISGNLYSNHDTIANIQKISHQLNTNFLRFIKIKEYYYFMIMFCLDSSFSLFYFSDLLPLPFPYRWTTSPIARCWEPNQTLSNWNFRQIFPSSFSPADLQYCHVYRGWIWARRNCITMVCSTPVSTRIRAVSVWGRRRGSGSTTVTLYAARRDKTGGHSLRLKVAGSDLRKCCLGLWLVTRDRILSDEMILGVTT